MELLAVSTPAASISNRDWGVHAARDEGAVDLHSRTGGRGGASSRMMDFHSTFKTRSTRTDLALADHRPSSRR